MTDAAKFHDNCISGHLKSGTPTGKIRKLGGLNTYVATPAGAEPSAAILLISDVFGWELVNARLIADEFAKHGFLTVLPDFFQGDALPADVFLWPSGIIAKLVKPFTASYQIGTILLKHGPASTNPLVESVLQDLRFSYPSIEKVGAQGYSWGGKYCGILGAHPFKVDAISVAHPAGLSAAEIEIIVVPSLWCCAEPDHMFSAEARKNAKETLAKRGQIAKFVIYEGTSHGFAVRCDETDEKAQKSSTEALKEAIKFFKEHLLQQRTD